MKIEAEHSTYELPEQIEESTAELAMWSAGDPEQNPGSFLFAMARLRWGEFLEMQAKYSGVRGKPVMWSIAKDYKTLHVTPTPATDTWFHFQYCPAMKVL